MVRSRSKLMAFGGIYAALYAVATYLLPSISFLQMNIRVQNVLRGLLPFCPSGVILGNLIGVFIANIQSPLGPLGWISAVITSLSLYIGSKILNRSVLLAFFVHYLILTSWLVWLLSHCLGGGMIAWTIILAPQLFISDVLLTYIFYRFVRSRPLLERMLMNMEL